MHSNSVEAPRHAGILPIYHGVLIAVTGKSPVDISTTFTGFTMSSPVTKLMAPPVNNNKVGKNKKGVEVSEVEQSI